MTAQFTIQGIDGSQLDFSGIWQTATTPAVSFATSAVAEPAPNQTVWAVSLPDDVKQAQLITGQKKQALSAYQCNIIKAGQTLRHISADSGAMSFSVSNNEEATLFDDIAQLRSALDGGGVSFVGQKGASKAELPPVWRTMAGEYQAFMGQLFQLLKPTLRVETTIGQELLAYTLVDISGDFDTVWNSRSNHPYLLHRQILSLTLESRIAIIQLLAQICVGATALAAKFSMPGGMLFALPAAWRFIRDIMKQAEVIPLP